MLAERTRIEDPDLERWLELAIRGSGLGIWEKDLQTGSVNFSDRFRAIFGLPTDRALDLVDIYARIHPDDLASVKAYALATSGLDGHSPRFCRYRITRADTGDERRIDAQGELIFGSINGERIPLRLIGSVRDVTDQEAMQLALRTSERRLRLMQQADHMALWEMDIASGTVEQSPSLNAMFGLPRDVWLDVAIVTALVIAPHGRIVADLLSGKSESGRDAIEFHILRPDGLERVLRLRMPILQERRVMAVITDVTEMRQSEEQFRELADRAPVMIWLTGTSNNCTYMSRSWYEFTGQYDGGALGDGWLDYVHPDDRDPILAISLRAAREAVPYRLEYRIRRSDGVWRWFLDSARERFDASGEHVGHIGSLIDITERREAEEQRAVLNRELNHRVKNALTTVQAIVAQTLRGVELPVAVRHDLEWRMTAMASAHELLTQTAWEGAEIAEVVTRATAPFRSGGVATRIAWQGPITRLPPRAVLALAMVVHELATNATKYGALSTEAGRVAISWSIEDGIFAFEWREEDGPPVVTPVRRGLGSRLIERSLTDVIGGKAEVDYRQTGLIYKVEAASPKISGDAAKRV